MRTFAFLAAALFAAGSSAADDPFELMSREGRFSAAFPADPAKTVSEIQLKTGAKISIIRHAAVFKKAEYAVAYNDYPKGTIVAKPQDVLKGVRDGNVGDGTLDEEKSGVFGPRKLPMRSFTYTRGTLHYRNLIVLDDHRLYQAMIVAESEGRLADETAEAFYKAFKIAGDPPPVVKKDKDGNFVSKEGRYSIAFPDTPKPQMNEVPLAGTDKKITVHNQVVEVGKSLAMIVAYNDYPAGVLSPDAQDVLQGVRDGNMGPEGKLLEETKGTFGPKKLPMREITFTKNNIHFRSRIILDGTRLYQVMIVAEDAKSLTNDAAKKYFDSFKLLPVDD
ncbi:MAG: hypothetical protein U0791_03375 [Gemmataceae bacterium]